MDSVSAERKDGEFEPIPLAILEPPTFDIEAPVRAAESEKKNGDGLRNMPVDLAQLAMLGNADVHEIAMAKAYAEQLESDSKNKSTSKSTASEEENEEEAADVVETKTVKRQCFVSRHGAVLAPLLARVRSQGSKTVRTRFQFHLSSCLIDSAVRSSIWTRIRRWKFGAFWATAAWVTLAQSVRAGLLCFW